MITVSFNTYGQGGETPKDLITKAANSLQAKDYVAFGKLFTLFKNEKPGEIDAMISIIKLYPKVIKFKDAGRKKFGKKFDYEISSGSVGSELDFGVNWKFDFEAAKNVTFHEEKRFDEMWAVSTTQIACENFEKPMKYPLSVVKKGDRWYMLLPTNRAELLKALEKFVPEAQKLLEQSKSAEDLADKLRPLLVYFNDFHDN